MDILSRGRVGYARPDRRQHQCADDDDRGEAFLAGDEVAFPHPLAGEVARRVGGGLSKMLFLIKISIHYCHHVRLQKQRNSGKYFS